MTEKRTEAKRRSNSGEIRPEGSETFYRLRRKDLKFRRLCSVLMSENIEPFSSHMIHVREYLFTV